MTSTTDTTMQTPSAGAPSARLGSPRRSVVAALVLATGLMLLSQALAPSMHPPTSSRGDCVAWSDIGRGE